MQILVSASIAAALAVVFGWLTTRAWASRQPIVKWAGIAVSGLITLLCALIAVVGVLGYSKVSASSNAPVPAVQIAGTPEQRARGERLAAGCAGCHSTTQKVPLDGGSINFGEIPGGPSFGTIVPPNLTPGGRLKDWTDGEIVRAIREGVSRDGRPLIIMPSESFHNLADADVQSIVAYLRSQPAVTHDTPATNLNLLAGMLLGVGMFPTSVQTPITSPIIAPPAGVTADYGKYIVSITGCDSCHGADLSGGAGGFGPPPGPNLKAIVPTWTEAAFLATLRTGTDPAGHALDPEEMPWREISTAYNDDELKAVYAYIKTLR